MNVGLPGTGIGGMFYILSALCTLVVEGSRALHGRPGRWRLALWQGGLALGIGLGIWVAGWMLGVVLSDTSSIAAALRGLGVDGRAAPNVLRAATFAVSLVTLGAVIVSVWIARLWVHGAPDATRDRPRQRRHPREPARLPQRDRRKQGLRVAAIAAMLVGASSHQLAAQVVFEPSAGATRDSDGNRGLRTGLAIDAGAESGTRVGVEAARWQVEDGIDRIRSYSVAGRVSWRAARVRGEVALGGTMVDPSGLLASETVPTGRLRLRFQGPTGFALDLRARRGVLDASPDLMANLVVRNEGRVTLDVPVTAFLKLRGSGRAASLDDRLDRNRRTDGAGMVVLLVSPSVELTGQFHTIGYDHVSTAGYYAPRLVQIAQAGSYGEVETASVLLAYEITAGVQRFADSVLPPGSWRAAGSLWSQVGFRITEGTQLRVELELYSSPAAALAAGPGWKYGAAGISLRQRL